MTFQEIQALIADIDRVLAADDPAPADQQAALEQARSALVSLRNQQAEVTPAEPPDLQPVERETAAAIAQAVMAQLNRQRSDWLQPVQQELELLRQQRQAITRDVQRLENQQTQLMSNFLQVLLGRCSESLRRHIAKALQAFEAQILATQRDALASPTDPYAPLAIGSPLQQLERLEQLRALEQQADALVGSLDRTFHSVFSSLEGDLQSYQQSLAQALERMHALGQQGEAILSYYVGRSAASIPPDAPPLAMPLQVERSQRSLEPLLPEPVSPAADAPPAERAERPAAESGEEPFLYPFAGVELAGEPVAAITRDEVDAVADLLALDLAPEPPLENAAGGETWDEWDEQLFSTDLPVEAQPDPEPEPLVLTPPLSPAAVDSDAANSPLPVRLEDALFDSQHDPATLASERALEMPRPAAQPLEVVLFGDRPQTAVESVAAEPVETLEAAITTVGDVKDTIASLSELLEQVYQAQAEVAAEIAAEEGGDEVAAVTEDVALAAANEILLATEANDSVLAAEWEDVLDAEQIRQLDEDLARFGSEPESPAPIESATTPPTRRSPAPPKESLELDVSPFAPLPSPQTAATEPAPTPVHPEPTLMDDIWQTAEDSPPVVDASVMDRWHLTAPKPEPPAVGEPIGKQELAPWGEATAAAEPLDWADAPEIGMELASEPAAVNEVDIFADNPEDVIVPIAKPAPLSITPVPARLAEPTATAPKPAPASTRDAAALDFEIAAPEDDGDITALADATVIHSMAELTAEPWSDTEPTSAPS
ncbi:MAG: hypothetical protein HC910_01555 [Spirulinaceae cyanobacterium SM2_1_0]|nr:hypothetical protein [Spirulinaceae cyanobacterium SM2_1_0]